MVQGSLLRLIALLGGVGQLLFRLLVSGATQKANSQIQWLETIQNASKFSEIWC